MMRKRRTLRRWLAIFCGGMLALVLLGGVAGWFAFQRIPSWFQPVSVPQSELSRVRNSLPNTYQALNDGVRGGRPFDFVLSDRTVTEWIVARGELYPDAREWLPDWVRDVVVVFDDDRCIVGAHVTYDGWQTILGITLSSEITEETISVRVERLTAGALPVPLPWLAAPLDRLLDDDRLDVDFMPDAVARVVEKLRAVGTAQVIAQGVSWRNLLTTRRGRRALKIREASSADGSLFVRIEPR